MSESHTSVHDSLPQSVMEQIDSVCDRFEDAWLAGQRPRIDDFLAEVSDQRARQALVKELIALDINHRQKLGETILPRDYERFSPQSANALAATAFETVAARERYRIGEKVGVGGMGEVRKGRDLHLDRELAIKVLRAEHKGEAHLQRRFLEEARIGGRLQHPGIVPVHDLGELPDGRPFFTMKLVEGRTLAALVEERAEPSQDLPRFLTMFEQICQTLAYAHAQGVIHRDLKPANVMVGAFGEVQVMDWGLAKVLQRSSIGEATEAGDTVVYGPVKEDTSLQMRTQPGQAMGTYAYMPPEQARGEIERVDERSDVFGLGGILCEILTGRPPFSGRDRSEIFAKVKACDHAEAMARLDTCGADTELLQLARTCLAAKPEDRPANAGVVAESLKLYLSGVQERLRAAERERAAAQARAEEAKKTAAAEQARAEEAEKTAAAEQARAEEEKKRAAAERQSRRRMVAVAGLVVFFIALLGGGTGWVVHERATRQDKAANDMESALERSDFFQRHGKRAEALAEFKRAELLAGEIPSDSPVKDQLAALKGRLDADVRDQEFITRFEEIRLREQSEVDVKESNFNWWAAFPAIREALRQYGIAIGDMAPAQAAARIQSRPESIRRDLLAALDECYNYAPKDDRQTQQWLLTTLEAADNDAWRMRVRKAVAGRDWKMLDHVAHEADVRQQPPSFLLIVVRNLPAQMKSARLELLRRTQRVYPADLWANHELAFALQTNQPAEAVRYYTAALVLRPKNPGIYLNRGRALEYAGELDAAIADYRQSIALAPQYVPAYNNLGIALAKKNKLDEAIPQFRTAIELDSKSARSHTNLGNALRMKNQLDEAIHEFRTAIKLDLNLPQAHDSLGIALATKGGLEEAIREFCVAIELDPESASPHNNLGLALQKKKQLDEAISEFRTAIELDPKDTQAHDNLGIALFDKNQLDEAIREFRATIFLDPKNASIHDHFAIVLHKNKQREEAIWEFRTASELDPKNARYHNNLGYALYTKGQLDEAIGSYRTAIQLDPKAPHIHHNLGEALCNQGKPVEAEAACRKAIALKPDYAHAYYSLGNSLKAQGKQGEEEEAFRKAIALKPDYAEAHCNLGDALHRQGRFKEALAARRRGHELGSKQPGWSYPSFQWVRNAEHFVEVEKKLPSILSGQQSPANPGEAIDLAWMCQQPYQKRYAASVRLYANAFAAQPKLASDLKAQHRCNAARSAALAAGGKGEDARLLPDTETATFRRRALGWLREDLAAYGNLSEQNNPAVKRDIQQRLAHWQHDPDLAGLRDKNAVDKLPQDERDACRKLWADVADLLRRIQEK